MLSQFSKNIAEFVNNELTLATKAREAENVSLEFQHLETAHVLGQESTYWHVLVHIKMLLWAVRNTKVNEFFGQLFRIIGAATKTVFGLVPQGNTGGANVSPFKKMPLRPELQGIIKNAKTKK
jgi:hypothetical protein